MNELDFLDRVDFAALPGDLSHRAVAVARFRERGWPTRREEAWHYTDLRAGLRDVALDLPGPGKDSYTLPEFDAPRIVFVNGAYAPSLSAPPAQFKRFAEAAELTRGADSAVVALNAALAGDGATITVPAGEDAGRVLLVSIGDSETPAAITLRHRISMGEGAKLTLIEVARGEGSYLHDPVWELDIAEGAELRHYRLQDEPIDAVHVATIFVDLAARAHYQSFAMNTGARLSRTEIRATLAGEEGDVALRAAQLLDGNQHGDVTTIVSHDAPNCGSRQIVKSILDGKSRGVFQGRIEVARPAQKTDGYQMNEALLLSPQAEIDAKPELEIFADDVKCSHGAAIGALDPEQLFYLRSRGVPEAEARAMLIRAFLEEAIDVVEDDGARALFEDAIESWWRRKVG